MSAKLAPMEALGQACASRMLNIPGNAEMYSKVYNHNAGQISLLYQQLRYLRIEAASTKR